MKDTGITPLQVTLIPKKQDYIELHFPCCEHIGHENSDTDKIAELLGIIKSDPNAYMINLGDSCEMALPATFIKHPGSAFSQTLGPKSQVEEAIKVFTPVKHKIIGMQESNHSLRMFYQTQFSVEEMIANKLGVPFMGLDGLYQVKVGKQLYDLHCVHGSGGASGAGGVLNRLEKSASRFPDMEIFVLGHFHRVCGTKRMAFDRNGKLKEQTFIGTGSFLGYTGSYGHIAGYQPLHLGASKVRLYANKHNVEVIF